MKLPVVLKIYRGDTMHSVKQFLDPQVVIGRQPELQVCLDSDRVALIHATIEKRNDDYYLTDLGSETGTFLKGERILDAKIASGDQIQIGDFRIEFHIGIPKVVSEPPPAPKISVVPPPPVHQAPAAPKPAAPSAPPPAAPAPQPTRKVVQAAPSKETGKKKKGRKTFAPGSKNNSVRDLVKPLKGTVVEVMVAWKERIIAVQHFSTSRIVSIGSAPENDIIVPISGFNVHRMPVVKIDGRAIILLPPGASTGEFVRGQSTSSLEEVRQAKRIIPEGSLEAVVLEQGEMAKIDVTPMLSVVTRYVPDSPKPLVPPFLDLTASEFTGVMLPLVMTAILALYMFLYTPPKNLMAGEDQEPQRVATVLIEPTPPPKPTPTPAPTPIAVATPEPPKPKPTPPPQIVRATPAPKKEPKPKVAQTKAMELPSPKKDPGQAANAAANRNKDKKQEVTSAQSGGAIKTAKTEGAQAQAVKPKPEKSGVFSVFGSGGAAQRINESSSGVGDLAGSASQRSGTTGSAVNRPGAGIGSDIKDTGAGGTGTAVAGIKGGIFGEGKGTSGSGSGLGGTGLARQGTKIQVGGNEETFSGTIDRDAIRRVIQQNLRVIRACYERELNRNPNLFGKLVLQWDIGDSGRVVAGPTARSNDMGNHRVVECIAERMRLWKFPDPPVGQVVTVTYPFVFSN